MCHFGRKRPASKLFAILLALMMVGHSVAVLAESDRIYPSKKATLYRGDIKMGEYTKEAPLPEGTVISTDGRCAVKLDDLYLVAEDQSVFSINTSNRQRNLFIKHGIIYFKTSSMNRSLAFITPSGPVDVQRIRLQAAANGGVITGFVSVTDKQAELGVAEGGALDVVTEQGPMTIQSGEKIILSQADMDIGLPESEEKLPAQEPPETKPKMTTGKKVAIGAVVIAAIAGMGIAFGGSSGGGSDGGGSVSPSTP